MLDGATRSTLFEVLGTLAAVYFGIMLGCIERHLAAIRRTLGKVEDDDL